LSISSMLFTAIAKFRELTIVMSSSSRSIHPATKVHQARWYALYSTLPIIPEL
jgi:hypothetical protein